MELLMSWKKIGMVFSIYVINVGNGGNDIKMCDKGMFPRHNLLQTFMNALTQKPTI
jgi:hypothetical protein